MATRYSSPLNGFAFSAAFRSGLSALHGFVDRKLLERRLPGFHRTWRNSGREISANLSSVYSEYVTKVSDGINPISFQLGVVLLVLCRLLAPSRILDLGSGFSSYVFRSYQREATQPVEVWSVDDAPEWLEQTREFLEMHELSTSGLASWDAWADEATSPFDLVLYDSWVYMKQRQREFTRALRSVRQGTGVLVLDDMHKRAYRSHVHEVLRTIPHAGYSLYSLTHDEYSRYAYLITDLHERTHPT